MNIKHMMGAALVGMLLLTACSKKAPSYARYIPKESNYVMAIDVQAIMGKLQKDSLSVDNMMDAFKDSSSDYAKAVSTWKDFKDAGVDFSNKIFVAVAVGNMMGNGSTGFEMVGGVKDAAKLEAFIKKQPHFNEIKKGDGFSYAGEDNMMVGWNDDAVIIVGNHENNHNNFGLLDDNANTAAPRSQANDATAADKLKKYFKLDKNESIASVDQFKELMGKTADISIFGSSTASTLPVMVTAVVPNLKDLMDGVYSATLINFEAGKVDIKTTGFVGEKLAALIKKYPSGNVDMGMVENYPSNNVDGLMAFSFNTQLIPAFIKEAGAEAGANAFLGQMGMNADDLAKIFKGDFAFVVSDFGMAKKQYGSGDGKMVSASTPSAKMLFSAKIGDKAAFDKLLSIGEKQGFLIRQGNSLLVASNGVPMQGLPYAISLANDMLTITSDSAIMTAYFAKTQKIGLADNVKSQLKSTSAAFYVDIEKILTSFGNDTFDSTNIESKNMLDKAKGTFKNAWFTSGDFDGKKMESKGELVMMDPNKNSLSQLVNFSIYASQQHMASEAKREKMYKQEDMMMQDSAAMVAPATK